LGSAGGALVLYQFVASDHEHLQSVEVCANPCGPDVIETHPVDVREQIDTVGWTPKLNHSVGVRESLGSNADAAEPELLERTYNGFAVLARWSNEQVDVVGQARISMERDRVSPNSNLSAASPHPSR
jgi:hypothetical protein